MAGGTTDSDNEDYGGVSLLDSEIEPLASQFRSLLPTDSQRDSHSPYNTASATQASRVIAVRSSDGSRWLPAPVEQSHRYGSPPKPDTDNTVAVVPELAPPLEPHTCNAAVCAVAKVFETTELLEVILAFLESKDICSLRRTSPVWNATINTSPELRLHQFYYPQFTRPASGFQLLSLILQGLTIDLGEPIHRGQWISVSLTLDAANTIVPNASGRTLRSSSIFGGLSGGQASRQGSSRAIWIAPSRSPPKPATAGSRLRYSDLYITQPPILGIQAFIIAPSDALSGEGGEDCTPELIACAKLSCDAGITLGFLAETVKALLASSKHEVGVKVLFKAIVSFPQSEIAPRKRGVARSVTRIG
ncbi:hypothetical protein LTR56_001197 [Elasticomyces elasticus]|nr:hypothetical protein LTR22_016234 [Elasticomyces elasticus]KAK3659833.1 hypothetical protein LTR56_001197 [Elasticomyces elasticus]KAK4914291.1 hypothetical protein LTR49_017429 [Elasticomyces elasticus]KAK5769118.1 hypothetical protein LTS12_000832 [Elasticomyces elasticus]